MLKTRHLMSRTSTPARKRYENFDNDRSSWWVSRRIRASQEQHSDGELGCLTSRLEWLHVLFLYELFKKLMICKLETNVLIVHCHIFLFYLVLQIIKLSIFVCNQLYMRQSLMCLCLMYI